MQGLDRSYIDRLLHGEAVEALRALPDECIPMTLTSPPYDGLRDYGSPPFTIEKFRELAQQLHRVTVPGGVVAWVVQDGVIGGGISGTSFRQCSFFQEIGFRLHDEIIVQKSGKRGGGNVRYGPPERVFVFSKGKPRAINLIRDKRNKHAGRVVTYTRRTTNGELVVAREGVVNKVWGFRPGVWGYSAVRNSAADGFMSAHPASMLPELAEDLILSWSRPGDVILDPMAGGGATLKVALLTNRRYLGVEFVGRFVEVARKRLAEAQLVHRLNLESELFGLLDEEAVEPQEPAVRLLTAGNKKVGPSVLMFNLPVKDTCPGKSPACASVCYADKGHWRWPQNRERNQRNFAAAQEPRFVARMVAELQRRQAGLVRVHSSGDFFDAGYVRKWRRIASAVPDCQFWGYTRSWRVPAILEELRRLAELPNFRLWFSCDRDTGLPPAVQNVRVAWLQTGGEPPQEAASGTTPATLVFPVKEKGRQPTKRIGLALVCPTYNGTPEGAVVTCESCGVCWSRNCSTPVPEIGRG